MQGFYIHGSGKSKSKQPNPEALTMIAAMRRSLFETESLFYAGCFLPYLLFRKRRGLGFCRVLLVVLMRVCCRGSAPPPSVIDMQQRMVTGAHDAAAAVAPWLRWQLCSFPALFFQILRFVNEAAFCLQDSIIADATRCCCCCCCCRRRRRWRWVWWR